MPLLSKINSPADIKELAQDELIELAAELRQTIVGAVAETGGHLASSLGVVELTVALHKVFDTPIDKLVWDVSHQTYCHKLLTGRKDRIETLRQYKGLSGFAKRTESEYDTFGAGHASTSISAALGFATARDLKGEDHSVVAVIGDGSLTGGLAFEGLNNAGSLKKDLLVILNDNTWSISKNVGALSKYLTSIMADEKFNKLRKEVWELTGRFKRRDVIREAVKRVENSIKNFLVPGMLFEKLGFRYFGPIDGHDLPLLIKTLQDIKLLHGPVMLHVATVKGKGYAPSEEDALAYHGIGKFNKVTGKAATSKPGLPGFTKVFGQTMLELAEKNDRVVAITAAMAPGTGLDPFADKFPDRFFDVGIAEGHAGTFSAGLAAEGIKPYFAVYSTFAQRAYDQIIHDMALQNLPVVLAMDRGGVVGADGPTHHGAFDLAYLSTIPNLTVAVPKDGNELRAMLHYTADNEMTGVTAIRYPRDSVPIPMEDEIGRLEWGSWEWVSEPGEVICLAVGPMIQEALAAARELAASGINLGIVNARFVKPMDSLFLDQVMRKASAIVTMEEGSLRGGFGQAVAEHLLTNAYDGRFRALAIPDKFVTHGGREQLFADIGLNADGLVKEVRSLLGAKSQTMSDPEKEKGLFKRLQEKKNAGSRQTSLRGMDTE